MQWTSLWIRLYSLDLGQHSEGETSHVGEKLLGRECLTEGCVGELHSEVIYDLLTLPHWGLSPQGPVHSAQMCCPFTYSAVSALKDILICIVLCIEHNICLLFASYVH